MWNWAPALSVSLASRGKAWQKCKHLADLRRIFMFTLARAMDVFWLCVVVNGHHIFLPRHWSLGWFAVGNYYILNILYTPHPSACVECATVRGFSFLRFLAQIKKELSKPLSLLGVVICLFLAFLLFEFTILSQRHYMLRVKIESLNCSFSGFLCLCVVAICGACQISSDTHTKFTVLRLRYEQKKRWTQKKTDYKKNAKVNERNN